MYSRLLLISLYCTLILQTTYAQETIEPTSFLNNCVLKTRPYQLISRNPVIGLEKPINRLLSIEGEFLFRNRGWESSGREWDFGRFYNSDGFRLMAAGKVYFGKTSHRLDKETQKAPIGFFVSMQLGFSYIKIHEIEKSTTISGTYENTVQISKAWPEINPCIGGQFFLSNHFTMEFYIGPSVYLKHKEKTLIIHSEDPEQIGSTHYEYFGNGFKVMPNIRMSIGYRFGKHY